MKEEKEKERERERYHLFTKPSSDSPSSFLILGDSRNGGVQNISILKPHPRHGYFHPASFAVQSRERKDERKKKAEKKRIPHARAPTLLAFARGKKRKKEGKHISI